LWRGRVIEKNTKFLRDNRDLRFQFAYSIGGLPEEERETEEKARSDLHHTTRIENHNISLWQRGCSLPKPLKIQNPGREGIQAALSASPQFHPIDWLRRISYIDLL
jgi:hypothetical protein